MHINQESLFIIPVPNSAITVSQMHIPSKPHFQNAVGRVKKFLLWSFEQNESNINLNFVLNSSAYMPKNLQTVSIGTWKQAFSSLTMEFRHYFVLLKTMCVLGNQESDFQASFMPLSVKKMS